MALVNFKEMLEDARNNQYAIGMFDVSDLEMIRAVTEEAEALHSPVMLGALWPDLEGGRLDYWFAAAKLAAEKASVPVCIHLDHANTLEQVIQAVNAGFSSVMLDASASVFEENIRRSREVAEAVRKLGISVEAELGHVGNGWVGSGESSESGPDMLTEPDKVAEFIEKTGVDALAVSIGTAHGVYMKAPALDIERLKNINAASPVPLVLHGGSGTPEDQLSQAIANGICKVNIYSELLTAWNSAMLEELRALPHMAAWPAVLRKKPDAAMREVIRQKIRFFGSANKC
ncbi:MAG: class II fructose-bisphosphate aldolase [Lentisphaerae bacterium]|nr:class II fructose-bisphosphate aldolase [Lentisphaerota bacterium]